jgi:hypothetical protein
MRTLFGEEAVWSSEAGDMMMMLRDNNLGR